MKKLLLLPMVAALSLWLASAQTSRAEPPTPAAPPTDEPGWVYVGDQTRVSLADGSVVTLSDQTRFPPQERIAWVRVDAGADTDTAPATPSVEPLSLGGPYYHQTSRTFTVCDIWSYCAYIKNTVKIEYYTDYPYVQVTACWAKTYRWWNNPYNWPHYSYNKVFAFEQATYGSYQPYGQAQADTWYSIPGCSGPWRYNSTWVRYGSTWDTCCGFPGRFESDAYVYTR